MTNLLTIYSLLAGTPISELEERYRGAGYGRFKQELAEVVVEQLTPIQQRLAQLSADPAELKRILERGRDRAREIAVPKMEQVREATGIALHV
jgi:tryptophanyl-tRNA synthetase